MLHKQRFCKILLKQREEGIRFGTFTGTKWFASKTILFAFMVLIFFMDNSILQIMSLFGTGYLLGMIVSNVRTFVVVRRNWPIHEQFINWEKVNQEIEKN